MKKNESIKSQKLRKISKLNSKKVCHFNSKLGSVDALNTNLFQKVKKTILKGNEINKNYNNNLYNSQRFINKIKIPDFAQNNEKNSLNTALNIIDNSAAPSRNIKKLNTNHISIKRQYRDSLENLLNNTMDLSNKINLSKKINKSCIGFNEENKEKYKLNDTASSKFNIRKLNKNKTQYCIISKKRNLNYLPSINNNVTKSILKINNIPTKKIYEYYIKKESNNIIKPIKNYDKFLKRKFKDPKNRFNKIYCINKSYLKRTKELKNNRNIAYKEDFDINEYQNAIMLFLQKRVGYANLISLGKNYREFNAKIERKFTPKGRFADLANKIMNNAPNFLVNKLKDLDKNKIIKRAKYLKSNFDIDKKNENKKENYFEEFDLYMENKYFQKNKVKK